MLTVEKLKKLLGLPMADEKNSSSDDVADKEDFDSGETVLEEDSSGAAVVQEESSGGDVVSGEENSGSGDMANGESPDSDTVLQFILDDVTEIILNYCHCEEVPEGLENTAYRMAIDLYRNENIGSEETPIGSVTSIREGDIQTSFANCVDENFRNTLLKNYTAQLNRFRKIEW